MRRYHHGQLSSAKQSKAKQARMGLDGWSGVGVWVTRGPLFLLPFFYTPQSARSEASGRQSSFSFLRQRGSVHVRERSLMRLDNGKESEFAEGSWF